MTAGNIQTLQAESSSVRTRVEDEIDLSEMLTTLAVHKWTIAIITVVIFAASALYAFTATPIYRAVSLIEVDENKGGVPGLDDLTSMFGEGPSGNKEMVLIKSYMVLGETVDRLHLNLHITPRVFPLIGSGMFHRYKGKGLAEPLFGFDSYAWGGELLEIDHFVITGDLASRVTDWQLVAGKNREYQLFTEEGDQLLTGSLGEAASVDYQGSELDLLVSRIVSRPGQSFSISLAPRNQMIERLKETLIVVEQGKDTGMIALTLDGENRKNITGILNTVSSFYVKSNIEKHVKNAQQVLDFIDKQLPELKQNLDEAQRELQHFRQQVGSVNMEFETQNALTQIMEFERMIVDMELKREELRRQFTESHPNVEVMDKQIEKMRGRIDDLEKQMHVLPEEEWEFIQKTRNVEVASALYVALLNKGQELRVAKASTVANVRVIDPAELLSRPVKPRKALILVVALLAGLISGVTWVMLRSKLHKGAGDPELIEKVTGIPVFANIPHSEIETKIFSGIARRTEEKSGEASLLAFENDTDLAMEAMRSFRTNMRFTMKGAESNVIIISGPSPSIGKSFFSSNYSAIAAKDGQRVLLVDADLRKGHLHKPMGVSISPGLSELIAGDVTIEETAHKIKDGLSFISCGHRPPNSAELVSSKQFQDLLEEFKQYADLVIIDTPPILAVADASIIAQYGGQLFVLIRSEQHQMGEILAATTKFNKSGVKVTGILINDVPKKVSSYGYAYEYK